MLPRRQAGALHRLAGWIAQRDDHGAVAHDRRAGSVAKVTLKLSSCAGSVLRMSARGRSQASTAPAQAQQDTHRYSRMRLPDGTHIRHC